MLRKCLKYALYVIVFSGQSISFSGSYEDFFQAVGNDDANTVRSLLARGFDPNTLDPKGQHALVIATQSQSTKVMQALLAAPKIKVEVRNSSDESPLMLASLNGLTSVARQLVDKGADVNKPGWAPLHYAATRGHLEIMTLLLDNHAYIDASSPNGTTPLMMAAFYGTPSAVKLLLEAGADPLLKNDQALSAIDFAHRNNRKDSADIISAFVRALQPKGKW